MSLDLLEDLRKKNTPQSQQPQESTDEDNFKKQMEQMYGYDEDSVQNEETLMKKFMATVEKMREARAKQMRGMVD